MTRPSCVVNIADLPGEKRPRFTHADGITATVRNIGDATGLARMGVHVRTIEPGLAGTHRHFHTLEEEWAYVLSGRGTVRIGPLRLPVAPGDFVGFPPGPAPHHFIATEGERLVLLEGGERRPDEDSGWYPDAGRRWQAGAFVDTTASPPPEIGSESQRVTVDSREPRRYQHDLDATVVRQMTTLHRPAGLVRQAVYHVEIEAGTRSTVLHTHDRTEEWVHVLEGHAHAQAGGSRFDVGPGDFMGHPAGSEPHAMTALTAMTYLMGGQIDAGDVVTYPEAGRVRIGRKLQPAE